MCVIIIKNRKNKVNKEDLIKASVMNPHGLGIFWTDTGEIQKTESDNFGFLLTDRPYIAHFRFATIGDISPENAHPFKIDKSNFLFQNGTNNNLYCSSGKTDTQLLAEILKDVPEKNRLDILELTNSRYVIANTEKKSYLLGNPHKFKKYKGLKVSKTDAFNLHIVAVYGTLKVGGSNYYNYLYNRLGAYYIGGAISYNSVTLVDQGLPFLQTKKGKNHHHINMDLFVVNSRILSELDLLEGHPDFYTRQKMKVHSEKYGIVTAYSYFCDVEYEEHQVISDYENRNVRKENEPFTGQSNLDICPYCGSDETERSDEPDPIVYCYRCDDYSFLTH